VIVQVTEFLRYQFLDAEIITDSLLVVEIFFLHSYLGWC